MKTPALFPACFVLALACALLAGSARASTYVVCANSNNIQVLSSTGANGTPIPGGNLGYPVAIAIDQNGILYVSNDQTPYIIEKFSPSGADLGAFTTAATLNRPYGLAFDSAGILYVANLGNNTVEKFSSTGTDLGPFIKAGSSNGLQGVVGIAFDGSGNFYAVNSFGNSVAKYTSAGVLTSTFNPSTLSYPYRIAFDTAGNFYVTNFNNNNVEKFSAAGVDQGPFPTANLNGPVGLVFDNNGNLDVCSEKVSNVEEFSTVGADLGALGSVAGSNPSPSDIAFFSGGQIEFSATAYQTFEDSGSVTITVNRVGGLNGAATVGYATSDGTAVAGTDYTATSGMLSWEDGDATAKTFQVPIADRGITSGATVNFDVFFIRATGTATLGSPASATVTITDNDAPLVEPQVLFALPSAVTILKPSQINLIALSLSDPSNPVSSAQFLVNGQPFSTFKDPNTVGSYYAAVFQPVPAGTFQFEFQVTARDGTVVSSDARTITVVDPVGFATASQAAFLAGLDKVKVPANGTLSVVVMTATAQDSTGKTVAAIQRVDFYADGVLFASKDGNGKTIALSSRGPGRGPITRDASATGSTTLFEATYQVPADSQQHIITAVATTSDGVSALTAPLLVTPVVETGTPPVATLGPLTGGQPVPAGASLVVPVTVSAPSVPVAMVQYYLNGALVSASTAPPYSVTVTPPTAGPYALIAVVTDTNGVSTFAEPLAFQAVPTVSLSVKGDGMAIVGGENGKVLFTRTGDDLSAPLTVYFKPAGSAVNGVNFRDVGGQLVIPAGASSAKLKIKPLDTGTGPLALKVKIKLLPAPDGSYATGDVVKAKLMLEQTQ